MEEDEINNFQIMYLHDLDNPYSITHHNCVERPPVIIDHLTMFRDDVFERYEEMMFNSSLSEEIRELIETINLKMLCNAFNTWNSWDIPKQKHSTLMETE